MLLQNTVKVSKKNKLNESMLSGSTYVIVPEKRDRNEANIYKLRYIHNILFLLNKLYKINFIKYEYSPVQSKVIVQ